MANIGDNLWSSAESLFFFSYLLDSHIILLGSNTKCVILYATMLYAVLPNFLPLFPLWQNYFQVGFDISKIIFQIFLANVYGEMAQ
jgi:hypothetical protein